jgi:EAL domain-containing protein (putative c-di-GMP-specific phosphodiesterase class I)
VVAIRTGSLPGCRPLLADPDDLTLVFQPVVDLAGATVAGYEALARFPGTAGPDVWFAAAAEAGLGADLEALLVHKALSRLPHLRASAFLLVAVQAHLLGSGPVQEAFATRPSLDGLVVEIRGGGRHRAGEPDEIARLAAALRARGAELAHATGGRQERSHPAHDLVILDRGTADAFAATGLEAGAGPRVLADGIETPDHLTAALRCGATLGRGWLFGLPSSAPGPLAPSVTDLVRTRNARLRTTAAVLPLVRPVRLAPAEATPDAPALEVDGDGTPVALLVQDGSSGHPWRKPVTLTVLPTAGAGETLRLALSRPAEHRYDPVLCTDEGGRPLGVLRIAELVRATAR